MVTIQILQVMVQESVYLNKYSLPTKFTKSEVLAEMKKSKLLLQNSTSLSSSINVKIHQAFNM